MVLLIAIIIGVIGFILYHKGGESSDESRALRRYGNLLLFLAILIIVIVNVWYPEHFWGNNW